MKGEKYMKVCPNCNNQMDDNATFCTRCGASLNAQAAQQEQPQQNQQQAQNQQYQQPYTAPGAVQPGYAPMFDPFDHTAEFDAKDISDNKVFAVLGYLLGTIGIIIALLASRSSAFTMFHVRQALKFTVVEILMLICTLVLFWTIIVPIAFAVMEIIFFVLKIICFFQICNGKAKEPAIIRNLGFLR